MIAQGIDVERIEVEKACIMGEKIGPPLRSHPLKRLAKNRSKELTRDGGKRAGIAERSPEFGEALARARAAAFEISVGQRHGIHRAGARPGDRLDVESSVFEQIVENDPGERDM